jgi:hypothetical protein
VRAEAADTGVLSCGEDENLCMCVWLEQAAWARALVEAGQPRPRLG